MDVQATPLRTLLASADPGLLEQAVPVLRKQGASILIARDALEAMVRWEDDAPSLVLLDARLPGTDGFALCRQMKERSRARVVLLAARVTRDVIAQGTAAGVDGYVPRQLSQEQLELALSVWLAVQPDGVAAEPTPMDVLVRAGRFAIDPQTGQVSGDRPVRLFPWEVRALYMLVINAGRVVPTGCLLDIARAWGQEVVDEDELRNRLHVVAVELGLAPAELGYIPRYGFVLARA